MISFLFSYIRSHFFRSLSLFIVSGVYLCAVLALVFIYQNISSALGYYKYDAINEHRFILKSNSNIFDLFGRESVGIPDTVLIELQSDSRFEKIQTYTLVDLPVLARFGFFAFGLESDVPVFAVSEGFLTGADIPIGISKAMLDFYNIQFAGSAPVFPEISESFLLGKSIDLTFGASKIFPSLQMVGNKFTGTIVDVDTDFPGFGIVLPESIVRSQMQSIGYHLSNPYKVVGYMKDTLYMSLIKEKYKDYSPQFDKDSMIQFEQKLTILKEVFFILFVFFTGILGIMYILLLFAFFRERVDIFRMIYVFGLRTFRARIMTIAEPMILTLGGGLAGCIFMIFVIPFASMHIFGFLKSNGLFFPPVPLDIVDSAIILGSISSLFIFTILLMERHMRRKIIK